jgi:hypothetical protein
MLMYSNVWVGAMWPKHNPFIHESAYSQPSAMSFSRTHHTRYTRRMSSHCTQTTCLPIIAALLFNTDRLGLLSKWHPTPYIVTYFCPEPYGCPMYMSQMVPYPM